MFALDQALLLDEPELTMLVLTRMLSIVSLGSYSTHQAKADSANVQTASMQNAMRASLSMPDRVSGMLQVAADGLHVAMHCVLACEPAPLPNPPAADSLPQVLDWVKAVRSIVSTLSGTHASKTVHEADSAAVEASLQVAQQSAITPVKPETVSNLDGRLREAHPKLHEALAFLEGARACKSEVGGAWFSAAYARFRELLSGIRAEGAVVFQNLVAATSDGGVPVLHEAVLDANVDTAELLLMLGASPLQRVPLGDGTKVHWAHGVDTPSCSPAPTLTSNTMMQYRLRHFCCRPAAWQPVLKSASGAAHVAAMAVTEETAKQNSAGDTAEGAAPAEADLPAQPVKKGALHLAAAVSDSKKSWPEWVSECAAGIQQEACQRRRSAVCCFSSAAGDIFPALDSASADADAFSEVRFS